MTFLMSGKTLVILKNSSTMVDNLIDHLIQLSDINGPPNYSLDSSVCGNDNCNTATYIPAASIDQSDSYIPSPCAHAHQTSYT